MDGGGFGGKKLGHGPRTRTCYICGRQYGLTSFDIHVKQCRALWESRQALLPKKERKPCPADPGMGHVGHNDAGDANDAIHGGGPHSQEALDEMNRLASEAYNSVALSTCAHCGRSFLNEKLIIHNRSCTAEHPGKRVGAKH